MAVVVLILTLMFVLVLNNHFYYNTEKMLSDVCKTRERLALDIIKPVVNSENKYPYRFIQVRYEGQLCQLIQGLWPP